MTHDYRSLPPDLPAPVDDGAADHLPGLSVPAVRLPSTHGGEIELAEAAVGPGRLVVYVYPRTGTPGYPLPEGWDEIPGARGCTPHSCAFRDHAAELRELGARVAGGSAQTRDDQVEFAERNRMPFRVIADPERRLGAALDLPTFETEGLTLY